MKMSISGERCVEPGSACVAPASIIFLICSAPTRFSGVSIVISDASPKEPPPPHSQTAASACASSEITIDTPENLVGGR
nr:hypothetical protein [Microbacterium barkeri]